MRSDEKARAAEEWCRRVSNGAIPGVGAAPWRYVMLAEPGTAETELLVAIGKLQRAMRNRRQMSMPRSGTKARGYRHASARRARAPSEGRTADHEGRGGVERFVPAAQNASRTARRGYHGSASSRSVSRRHASPLYIQERIHPSEFVRGLTKARTNDRQESLFGEFNNLPEEARYRWYQHQG